MNAELVRTTVGDQRRALVAWSIGLLAVVGAMGALWPTVRDLGDLTAYLEGYPPAVRDLFRIDAITTGPGYLDAELFSIVLPAMFIVFAVGRGARLVAGDEESGALDGVLAAPLDRWVVLVSKALGLVVGVALLGAALFLATWLTSVAFGMGVALSGLLAGALAMVALGVAHGLLALAAGAAWGRRSVANAVGGGAAVAGYLLLVGGELVDGLARWQRLSPFHLALVDGPAAGTPPATLLAVVAVGVAAVAASAPRFERRDVGT